MAVWFLLLLGWETGVRIGMGEGSGSGGHRKMGVWADTKRSGNNVVVDLGHDFRLGEAGREGNSWIVGGKCDVLEFGGAWRWMRAIVRWGMRGGERRHLDALG